MKEISVLDFEGLKIGQAQDEQGGTGCTVFLMEEGAPAGLDVRGGGPASRESELLKPLAAAQKIHSILLSGGSAFGLDAAGGVMQFLEERNIGLDVGITKVPLVCQSCIFDLTVGDMKVRPDQRMAYEACQNAYQGCYQDGNYGAGIGASVGKLYGMDYAMKSGVGSYAVQVGDLKVGAVVVVNALGDIYDWKNGQQVAGLLNQDHHSLRSSEDEIFNGYEAMQATMATNTTIGVILTNAKFDKTALCKIAGMTHNGYARSIRPVHTSHDGDTIYALSLGDVKADQDMIGTLSANVMSEAILRAVKSVDSKYGLKAWKDLKNQDF